MSGIHRSSKWGTFTRTARPIIKASLPAPCVNAGVGPTCTGIVFPGETWDVAHRVSHHRDPFAPLTLAAVGPAHRSCNRRAGAREGRAKQLDAKRGDQRLPSADSGWHTKREN